MFICFCPVYSKDSLVRHRQKKKKKKKTLSPSFQIKRDNMSTRCRGFIKQMHLIVL
jgi:hypothetical protein